MCSSLTGTCITAAARRTYLRNDPPVLYVSAHQSPLYPGTGWASEVGGPDALGLTVNVPLPPGATGDVVGRAFDEIAMPVVDEFSPTWVLVSAGFDAHAQDPLAELRLTSGDFAAFASFVAGIAPGDGRLAIFLEGGYDLDALQASVGATCRRRSVGRSSEPPTSLQSGSGRTAWTTCCALASNARQHWKQTGEEPRELRSFEIRARKVPT